MYFLRQLSNFVILACLATGLTGCGGGGGDSDRVGFDSGTGLNEFVYGVAPATDGSGDIYVGGDFTNYRGISRNRIVRVNRSGSIDDGFDPGTGFNFGVYYVAVAIDGSGDIYVGGDFTDYNGTPRSRIARINSDGSVDTGFAPGTGFNGEVTSIALAADGSSDIYVGGSFSTYRANDRDNITRINSNGSNDAGFATGSGFDSFTSGISPATDGSGDIYVSGGFTLYRGNNRNSIVRINSDGSNDAGFDPGAGFNSVVFSIVSATDGSGDLYLGGAFTEYNGVTRNRMARINSDGFLDTGFDPGTGFDNPVWKIAPAADVNGNYYVGGDFTTYRSTQASRIIRLDSSGTRN